MPLGMRPAARCHLCGRTMFAGICVACDRPPSRRGDRQRVPAWLLVWLWLHRRPLSALLVTLAGVTVTTRFELLPHAPAATAASHAADRPASPSLTPAAAARTPSTDAVVPVNVPTSDWDTPSGPPGYAFAVRAGPGSAVLLTDYHLLVATYLAGQRSVIVAVDGHTLTGQVVAVAPEPHVARIVIHATLRSLSVARTAPRPGDLVTVRAGGRRGLVGRVTVFRGPGGRSHLAFTASVPPELDGAPVLNASQQVVGIAEPTEQFAGATGIGFAVPISSACAAVTC